MINPPDSLEDGQQVSYLPAAATDLPEALRGTGIRLEDDVLVTESGAEVLTAALPIRADEVAAMVRG